MISQQGNMFWSQGLRQSNRRVEFYYGLKFHCLTANRKRVDDISAREHVPESRVTSIESSRRVLSLIEIS
jgi:hypothetical protein